MKILVLNAGSSSIKYQLFEMADKKVLISGVVEKIGEERSTLTHKVFPEDTKPKTLEINELIKDHLASLEKIVSLLMDPKWGAIERQDEIDAVGHRVVHGAEKFSKPTLVNSAQLEELKEISFLAPLHNPANIKGIEVASKVFQNAKQVAVFDTAFHQTMPDFAYRYAIPETLYKKNGLRAYGFHGTSHQYVSREAARFLSIPLSDFNAITIHLGNGCSMTAIKGGKSVATSMGLTPLGGLIMGTRSGDIDPSLLLFLGKNLDMSASEVDHLLNKESGLKGLTGDNDLRNILSRYDKQDPEAVLAIEMYVYRIRQYLGSYAAILGRLDAVIFTAGVGENSSVIRQKVCTELKILGIVMDDEKNDKSTNGVRQIQSSQSQVNILVVPTNEELEIASQAANLLS